MSEAMDTQTEIAIDRIYETMDGSDRVRRFAERHGIETLNVLTILTADEARCAVSSFVPEIYGKRVVEIGGGVGYLALEIARHAKSVVSIESDPAWSWVFTKFLYQEKPAHLTWVFGHSSTVQIQADVAVICSRSGLSGMIAEARRMAPKIVLISCSEPFVSESIDPAFDMLALFTKRRVDQLFSDAADALHNPDKRAAYEAATGIPVDWDKIAAEHSDT